MRLELLAVVMLLSTGRREGGWADLHFERLPADPRLGTEFAQASPLRSGTFASAWNQDAVYVAVLEDPGLDVEFRKQPSQLRAYRIDPATGASTRLPDPPFPPFHDEWGWATPWVPTFLGAGMMIAEESADWRRILVWENGVWRQFEYPIYIRSAESIAGRPGDQFVIISGSRALTYSALTWEELPLPPRGQGGARAVGRARGAPARAAARRHAVGAALRRREARAARAERSPRRQRHRLPPASGTAPPATSASWPPCSASPGWCTSKAAPSRWASRSSTR